jgi:hypothetical protein
VVAKHSTGRTPRTGGTRNAYIFSLGNPFHSGHLEGKAEENKMIKQRTEQGNVFRILQVNTIYSGPCHKTKRDSIDSVTVSILNIRNLFQVGITVLNIFVSWRILYHCFSGNIRIILRRMSFIGNDVYRKGPIHVFNYSSIIWMDGLRGRKKKLSELKVFEPEFKHGTSQM